MSFSWLGFSDYVSIFQQFSWLQWGVFSIAVNIFLYLFSITLYLFIEKTCRKNQLQSHHHPVCKSDLYISFLTIICNCIVMLAGVLLWKNGWIILNENPSVATVFVEIAALILLMDFFMYLFHYTAHLPLAYKVLHAKHHEHVSTNFLSLFVLHPVETIGFGMMILALLTVHDFSVASITAYLLINLVWGTIGHLNKEFFPSKSDRFLIGTTQFHNRHHMDESKNFGFYTSLWDRLFGTYRR